ncbi:hypothetical protein Tco_0631284 [Tanacetum coccineum]
MRYTSNGGAKEKSKTSHISNEVSASTGNKVNISNSFDDLKNLDVESNSKEQEDNIPKVCWDAMKDSNKSGSGAGNMCLYEHRKETMKDEPKSHNVLGIAPVAIIDRQLPFEYTIASRSTNVMVPIPRAPPADCTAKVLAHGNAVYDAHNKVACLILGSMTPKLHRQFKNSSPYEMLQELKEEGKSISVGFIMDGLTSDFAGFVRNYNMHNMGKIIGELHALLIKYEKGLRKKAATPQVMTIQDGRIQKANKKSLNAKGKGKGKGKRKDKPVYIQKPKKP